MSRRNKPIEKRKRAAARLKRKRQDQAKLLVQHEARRRTDEARWCKINDDHEPVCETHECGATAPCGKDGCLHCSRPLTVDEIIDTMAEEDSRPDRPDRRAEYEAKTVRDLRKLVVSRKIPSPTMLKTKAALVDALVAQDKELVRVS